MYKPDPIRMREFWKSLQDVWIKLYGSPFATAAAINGHAPAGGCFLAISCEYRVMLPKYTIGLNETQLGIVAPSWFMDTMRNVIKPRDAEMVRLLEYLLKTISDFKIFYSLFVRL
jgi:Delta3-Delta2-enoyl-CoA isomerase